MKKIIVISLLVIFTLAVILAILAVVISFTIVKSTTDTINRKLTQKLARIVTVPQGIRPQNKNFYDTTYFWEMETPQGEVTGIRFKYNTGFPEDQKDLEATLELPEDGDPSIFTKVLPAVVTDGQALKSAQDIEKANFSANEKVGYKQLKLSIKPETKQTTRITWIFEKKSLIEEFNDDYRKLYRLPKSLLKPLYNLQKLLLDLLGP